MNILDILSKLGYDVISFKDGVYEVQFSKARQAIQGISFDIYRVKVTDVCFNGLGNLCVTFNQINEDGEIVDDSGVFDVYEYRNMGSDEMF